jgi:hypothetical protein
MIVHRTILLSAAVIGLSLANSSDARADLCFRYSKTGGFSVAKGAKLPEPVTCQTLALFEVGGRQGAATGMICRDAGITLVFQYNYDACLGSGEPEDNSYAESGTCRLKLSTTGPGALPTIASSCRLTLSGGKPGSYGVRSFRTQLDDLEITECSDYLPPSGEGNECQFNQRGFSGQALDVEQSPPTSGPDARGNR